MDRFRKETADNNGAGRISEEAVFGDEKGRDPEQLWMLSSLLSKDAVVHMGR